MARRHRPWRTNLRAAPPEVGGVAQGRVDDKFAAVIVLSDPEANFIGGELPEASLDQLFGRRCARLIDALVDTLINPLINPRCVEANLSLPGRENQIARIARVNAG